MVQGIMPMGHDTVVLDRVRVLRREGRTPKDVARALGLRPAQAAALVRLVAAESDVAAPAPAVVGCWVSPTVPWAETEPSDEESGLVGVVVGRRERGRRVSACGYLVDLYCLGVKNALGPRRMDEAELGPFVHEFCSAFDAPPQPITVEVASRLVWGAVDYAGRLGFEPHRDFAAAAGHLGQRLPGAGIRFGREGRPFYVQGPNDNPARVLRTLEATVGPGNFHFLIKAGR
jgi:hypothetical protein